MLGRIFLSNLPATERNALTQGEFAFPNQRKLPLEDAAHARNAIARFNQVQGTSNDERAQAWRRIVDGGKLHCVAIQAYVRREGHGTPR